MTYQPCNGVFTDKSNLLNSEIYSWLIGLIAQLTSVNSVWLFGSRANETATDLSDWDFLFVVNRLTQNDANVIYNHFRKDVDLFVNFEESSEFRTYPPFKVKTGSFADWSWKRVDERLAIYKSRKWVSDNDIDEEDSEILSTLGYWEEIERRAFLLWRR